MAQRLTDKQQKQIIAEYVEVGSYRTVAKKYNIAPSTVKRICEKNSETKQNATHKKEQNTVDILTHMETKKDAVNQIIDKYLIALLDDDKIEKATPAQLTTALGTLIDKFTKDGNSKVDTSLFEAIAKAAGKQ